MSDSVKRVLKPIKNSVVCRKVSANDGICEDNSVLIKKENVPLYKILSYSVDDTSVFPFHLGDIVMSNSTGDEIEINKDEVVYLFKSEHIMCAVLD